MKHKLLFALLIYSTFTFSQQEASVWYFGKNAGLKFNPDGSITPLSDGKLSTNEGCASISDSSGNLLFYTDGRTVWDKNHLIMPNGDYFGGTGLLGDPSSTSSAMIVPKPGNPNIYYIFTLDEPHHENAAVYPNAFSGTYFDEDSGITPDNDDGLNNGLNYSIVDLSKIGSNGSIGDITSRNNHLITYDTNPAGEDIKYKCSEKLTAVRDASGNGYWVITQFTDNFYAFRVTSSGVISTPVKSAVLPSVPTFGYRRNAIGSFKASPDGKKLAAAYDQIDTATSPFSNYKGSVYTYDFDNLSGKVNNPKLIIDEVNAYGVEFSNDSKVLYASFYDPDTSQTLAQFDLLSNDVSNSKVVLFSHIYGIGALQLAPNNKIYYSSYLINSLGVINNPNVLGVGCDFNPEGQQLASNTEHRKGLPPFMTSFFDAFFTAKYLCLGNITEFTLGESETITSASWDFGDGTTSNVINPTHTYAATGTYSVSVTATNANGNSFKTKDIIIYQVPTATKPQNILVCDNNNDGVNVFDLTTQNTAILNGQDPNLYTVSYLVNNIVIASPSTYANAVPYQQETITAEVSNKANGECKSSTTFNIDVFDTPLPNLPTAISNLTSCDNTSFGTDNDGKVVLDLTQRASSILNSQSATQFLISYYKDAGLTLPILDPTSYQNTSPTETIFVKVTNKDNPNCTAITSFQIDVFALPVITNTVDLKQCDDDIDGFSVFNLEEAISKITTNATSEAIAFFKTASDAQNNTNPIPNPTAYTNQVVSIDRVFVRVTNSNGCYRVAQLNLIVSTTQIPLTFKRDFTQCDDAVSGTNTDGIASFDFSEVTNQIQNIFPVGQQLDITYYRNLADAFAEKNSISDISNYRNIGYPNTQNIYIRVDSRLNNDCLGLGNHITLTVEPIPIVQSMKQNHCDDNLDGQYAFDTSMIQSDLLNGLTNVTVSYFDQNSNLLPSPLPNPFLTGSQTLKVVVTNTTSTACSFDTTLQFIVDDLPEAFPIATSLTTVCDDETDPVLQDGKYAFDTSSFQTTILGGQTGMTVNYFDENNNPLSSPLPNPFVTATQNVKVEVINPVNPSCTASTIIPFVVNPVPKIQLTGDELVCSDLPTFTKTINAGLLDETQKANFTYSWTLDGNPIASETNYDWTVNTKGIYKVETTNSQACSRTRTIMVNASDKATVQVDIVDLSSENSITVLATGAGDYVFSLDNENGDYQNSNIFANVPAGIHTVFVKDLNGCGIVPQEVAILGIPSYFTPNQDGYNDTWNLKGVNTVFNAKTTVRIFDRYGKMIKQINPMGDGWDGTYVGQQMPATDYWYSIQLEDGRSFKGHFSLKR